jgi:hypothetical protein
MMVQATRISSAIVTIRHGEFNIRPHAFMGGSDVCARSTAADLNSMSGSICS